MLHSKADFETLCRHHGINIRSIRADNGIYSSRSFQGACTAANQQLTVCGVGSHWQNGVVERAIGLIQATARTILLHAMAKWPDIIDTSFWPFAIRHSVNLYNISSRSGLHKSPWELFTGTPPSKHPSGSHVFGCPTFVLHKAAQDNPASQSTWASRTWQGVYVGFSSQHASTVAMIYNPSTKHITPQFHVTFDEEFSTVHLSDPTALESRLSKLADSPASWHFIDSYGDKDPYFFDDIPPNAPSNGPTVCLASTTQPLTRPLYRPVTCSPSFWHWKASNNIVAELLHCPNSHASLPPRPPCPTSIEPRHPAMHPPCDPPPIAPRHHATRHHPHLRRT
jgi:hypothetical protein